MNRLAPWLCGALLACAAPRSPAPEASPAPEPAPVEEDAPPTAGEHMRHHFRLVAEAREAVIGGYLEQARTSFGTLAAGEYGVAIPQEWMRELYDLQAAAERGARARDLAEAARAVGAVTKQCGACHRSHMTRPDVVTAPGPYAPRDDGSLSAAMARHAWAAEQLWLGLTVPRHSAWIRGAEALAEPWPPPPAPVTDAGAGPDAGAAPAPPVEEELARKIQALRDLAPKLRESQTPLARAEAYGELLYRCASCHAGRGL